MQSIGDQVRNMREALGMTQDQLAERAGLAQSMIAEIETGKRSNLNMSTIKKLAAGLNCEPFVQVLPKKDVSEMINERIEAIAHKIISTSSGSAAIELQLPAEGVIHEQFEKVKKLVAEKPRSVIWQKI